MARARHKEGVVVKLAGPVQTKVTIGRSGDRYEREADTVADRVNAGQQTPEISRIPPGGLRAQRQPEETESASDEVVQEKAQSSEDKEELVQNTGDDAEENTPSSQQIVADKEETVQKACQDTGEQESVQQATEDEKETPSNSESVQAEQASRDDDSEADTQEKAIQAQEEASSSSEQGDSQYVDDRVGESDEGAVQTQGDETDREGRETGEDSELIQSEQESQDEDSEADTQEKPVQAQEETSSSNEQAGSESVDDNAGESDEGAVQTQGDDTVGRVQETGADSAPDEGREADQASDDEDRQIEREEESEDEAEEAEEDPGQEAGGCGGEADGGGQEGEGGGESEGGGGGCGGGAENAAEEPAQAGEGEEAGAESDAESAGEEGANEPAEPNNEGRECNTDAQRQAEDQDDDPIQQQAESSEADAEPEETDAESSEDIQQWRVQSQEQDEPEDNVQESSAAAVKSNQPQNPRAEERKEAIAAGAIKNKCPGEPLAAGVRAQLENSLDYDLGPVRLHTGVRAREIGKKLKSKAFTHKNHIWLGPGQSSKDVKLLAHETTHVIQQGGVEHRKKSVEPSTSSEMSRPGARDENGGVSIEESKPDVSTDAAMAPKKELRKSAPREEKVSQPFVEEQTSRTLLSDSISAKAPSVYHPSEAGEPESLTKPQVASLAVKASEPKVLPQKKGLPISSEPDAKGESISATGASTEGIVAQGKAIPFSPKGISSKKEPLKARPPSEDATKKTIATPMGASVPKKVEGPRMPTPGRRQTPESPAEEPAGTKAPAMSIGIGTANDLSGLLGQFVKISPVRFPSHMKSLTAAMNQTTQQRRSAEESNPPEADYNPKPPGLNKQNKVIDIREKQPVQVLEALPDQQESGAPSAIKPHKHGGSAALDTGVQDPAQRLDQIPDEENDKVQRFAKQWMKRFFESVPTSDSGVNTHPGPIPRIELSGKSNPQQIKKLKDSGNARLKTEAAIRDRERIQDFGENDIAPEQSDEKITRKIPFNRPAKEEKCPKAEQIESYRFDPEDEADLDGRIRPKQEKAYEDQITRLAEAENERDSSIDKARADGARQIRERHAATYLKEIALVDGGKTKVSGLRRDWKKQNSDLLTGYDDEAGPESRQADRDIKRHVKKEQGDLANRHRDEIDRAVKEHKKTKKQIKEIKGEGKKESGSWLTRAGRWIKNQVKRLARWVSEKIGNLFKALRETIKQWFDEFKKWAIDKIEQARRWVIGKLEEFRKWAHAAVDRYLGRFPKIAKLFKRGIDFAVDTTKKAVNQTAAALKKGVALIIDGMAAMVDSALAMVEKVAQVALWGVCNLVVTGINLAVLLVQQDLESLIELVRDLPEPDILGPLWPALKYALLGYLETLQSKPEEEKKRYARKTRWLVVSPAYYSGVFLGVLKGLIWDGLVGLLRMLYDIVVGIPKALWSIYEFFKSRLEDVEAIEAMVAEAVGVWQALRDFIAKPEAVDQIIAFIRRSPSILHGMVREIYRQIKGWAYDAGAKAANKLFEFVLTSSHFEIGLAVGSVIGRILFEVALLFLTSGAGTLIKWGGKVLQTLGKAGRFLTSAAKGGTIIMRALRSLQTIIMRGLNMAKRIGKGLGRVFNRLSSLVKRIFAWFKRGFKRLGTGRKARASSARGPRQLATKGRSAPGKSARTRKPSRPGKKRSKRDRGKDRRNRLIFKSYRNAVNAALKVFRVRGISLNKLREILRLYRRPRRVKRVVKNPIIGQITRLRYRVRAFVLIRPPGLRRVATVKRLPTGMTRKEAIGIHWYKSLSWYPQSIPMTPLTDRWARRGRTPPAGGFSISMRGRNAVEVPPTQYRSFPTAKTGPDGRRYLAIGVAHGFLPRVRKIMKRHRSRGVRRPSQGRFRTLLRNYRFSWSGREADHVQDIGWGGRRVDSMRNLWPLDKASNQSGNQTYYQRVRYQRSGREIENQPLNLVGRWFRIRSIS